MNFPLLSFFPSWMKPRDEQKDILARLDTALKYPSTRFYLVDAPTGVGKSAIVYSVCKQFDHNQRSSIILTPLKALQDQYEYCFPEFPVLKGRSNYPCPLAGTGNIEKNATADEAPCKYGGKTCREVKTGKVECPYYVARGKALTSPTFVTNFDYFLLAKNTIVKTSCSDSDRDEETDISPAGHRKLLVIDEAHNIEDKIVNRFSFNLTPDFLGLEKNAVIPIFETVEDYEQVFRKSRAYLNEVQDGYVESLKPYLSGNLLSMSSYEDVMKAVAALNPSDLPTDALHALKGLHKVNGKLSKISEMYKSLERGDVWAVDASEPFRGMKQVPKFTPLKAAAFTNRLFSGFEKVILLSGTFMHHGMYAKEIGLQSSSVVSMQVKHPFPISHRPFYFVRGLASMAFKQQDLNLAKVANYVASLLKEKYANKKGIIFTGSYKLQEKFVDYVRKHHSDVYSRFLVAVNENKEVVVARHCSEKSPSILLTASMYEGIDLKHDFSRFQIFLKVPYPSLQSKRVAMMKDSEQGWYIMQTWKKLCQGYGRSIRDLTDYADSYMLDDSFSSLLYSKDSVAPTWMKDAIIVQPFENEVRNPFESYPKR